MRRIPGCPAAASEWLSFITLFNDLLMMAFTGVLGFNHIKQIATAVTTNEVQNSWRYGYLMDAQALFYNAFDLGAWRNCLVFWGLETAPAARDLNVRMHPPTTEEMDRNRKAMTIELQQYAEHQRTHMCGVFAYPECLKSAAHNHAHGADGKCATDETPMVAAAAESDASSASSAAVSPTSAASASASAAAGGDAAAAAAAAPVAVAAVAAASAALAAASKSATSQQHHGHSHAADGACAAHA